MKTGSKTAASIAFFLLVFSLLGSIINVCCFDEKWYEREYAEYDATIVTGMSQSDLIRSSNTLLDYLRDQRDDIVVYAEVNGFEREVFSKREKLHMEDVKKLYQHFIAFNAITWISGFALLGASLMHHKKQIRSLLSYGYRAGACAVLIFVGFLSMYALADFDAFWYTFHTIFFPHNTYWQMDPNVSIMINMYPSGFWFDLVIRIILIFAVMMILIWLAINVPWRKRHA